MNRILWQSRCERKNEEFRQIINVNIYWAFNICNTLSAVMTVLYKIGIIIPIFRSKNWCSARLCNLPKVTQLVLSPTWFSCLRSYPSPDHPPHCHKLELPKILPENSLVAFYRVEDKIKSKRFPVAHRVLGYPVPATLNTFPAPF